MADGCISNIVKYALFITNFLIFVAACAVLGCGIWILVDKPAFLDLLARAEEALPGQEGVVDIRLFTSPAYIIVVVASLLAIISFFGCCGAMMESRCMLGTYFVLILAMFVMVLVGIVLRLTGDFEAVFKKPLEAALKEYKDIPDNDMETAYKNIWNEVQYELKCCGVDNASDWHTGDNFGFPDGVRVPAGCCNYKKTGDTWDNIWGDSSNAENGEVQTCRRDNGMDETKYHFEGCYTNIVNTIKENQKLVSGVGIGVLVVMSLNMIFSLAMCMMVD
jgi:hypothetical protein